MHPRTERFRPFIEQNVDICIARDVLTKTDADIVK